MKHHPKDGDTFRTITVRVRVKPSEKTQLETNAAEAGFSLSDWIRLRTIGAAPLIKKPNPDRELLHKLLAELGKQGSNLNQIARHMNGKGENFTVPMKLITQLLHDIKSLTDRLRKTLKHGNQG
ncbi:plasmid mobilization protein [Taibaiella koreensis]|uniref:plasmid mobilization protein n=1 Tax=Taibaiella koreensis TaxID=1268548 RepID=UPI000E59B8E9|nr:plasmid mobilization relaxosome protein MobC [Taibaiella koreensis]